MILGTNVALSLGIGAGLLSGASGLGALIFYSITLFQPEIEKKALITLAQK